VTAQPYQLGETVLMEWYGKTRAFTVTEATKIDNPLAADGVEEYVYTFAPVDMQGGPQWIPVPI
jgi:hypothetical protein